VRVLQKLLCALGELEDMYMPIESAIGNRRLLKVEELASILTLKPKTIYNRLSKGQHFPIPVKRVGRSIRFDTKDVQAFLDNEQGKRDDLI